MNNTLDDKFLGIDIGGTNIKFAVINDKNELIYEKSIKLPVSLSGLKILDTINNQIVEILSANANIRSVGIGLPGVVNKEGIVIVSPNIKQFDNLNIKDYFTQKIDLPVSIDNDANVAAISEMVYGAGQTLDSFVYITLGTGVGGAIILNKSICHGTNGAAGEIGHLILNPFDEIDNEAPYRTGVLETYLGKAAIIRTAKNLSRKYQHSPIVLNNKFDVASISHFADLGDLLSIETMKLTGYYLGLGIVSIANILDISDFIIGGGISKSSQILYNSARETACMRVLPHLKNLINIQYAKFIDKAGVIGAALFGKSKL
jgi:glucokinase